MLKFYELSTTGFVDYRLLILPIYSVHVYINGKYIDHIQTALEHSVSL